MMKPIILRPNAIPVYRFLSLITRHLSDGDTLEGKRILDCGAGGPIPPLAVFAEQGMDTVGIDINAEALQKARTFANSKDLPIKFLSADMRNLPFPDSSFDYVYEQYAMCHLAPHDVQVAVAEMRRVLRPGGMLLFGVISRDSWPKSSFGEEREPGWFVRGDKSRDAAHSMLSDANADALAAGMEPIHKQKIIRYTDAEQVTEEQWSDLYEEAPAPVTREKWAAAYGLRAEYFRYVHTFFIARKPA